MDPAAAKQQIAERVKQANRFLVTVNANPTVDQLAACIGLTLLINKMNKHATAVFSGKVPNTIEFLQPEKTIERNPDSLRDFIISLDKNKADKLRYKVEDDVVRIYVTPYHTSLSEGDFTFSEGDFNVEVVLALGVAQRSNLDKAITSHGRILHDATVISLNAGQGKAPDLGQINWQDPQASSLSEMLVSISESFGGGLIDVQIATAFLTGIVSETNRFSNKKTSPKVMTMSAQLMAAGANQQLIVQKLEPPAPPPQAPPPAPRQPKEPSNPITPLKPEGVIEVPKEDDKKGKTDIDLGTTEIHIDEQGNISTKDSLMMPPEMSQPMSEVQPVEKPHSFMGSTAQPAGSNIPFGSTANQQDWTAPYEMAPTDPLKDVDPLNPDIESSQNSEEDSSKGHDIQPAINSDVTPVGTPVDSARNAVESAFANSSSGSPLGPDQPINSGVLVESTISDEKPAAPAPARPANDTPVLNLPFNGTNGSMVAPPLPPPVQSNDAPAPPPTPPPLMPNGIPH